MNAATVTTTDLLPFATSNFDALVAQGVNMPEAGERTTNALVVMFPEVGESSLRAIVSHVRIDREAIASRHGR